jgi:HK97 family phage prohead protease
VKNKELEQRNISVEWRASESGVITGRPVVFNSLTDIGYFDEIIEPGALDGTDMNDVRLCLNHDTSYVYARSRRNNPASTMRLRVDGGGLAIEAQLDIEGSPKARDLYSAVKRGDIDHMSFMFSVADDEWENLDSDHPTRHIHKIASIVEVSAVTFPAYDATSIQARSKEALENAKALLESEGRSVENPVETGIDELELLKLKTEILSGGKSR